MRRLAPLVCRTTLVRLVLGAVLAAGLAMSTIHAQIPGRNINMVSGGTWPEGDPFLQRQNEPSIAASTRNPLHLLAGSNDYRTVDLPGLGDDEIGDAWLGLYKSFDGGHRWTSSLLPGYPQDPLCDPTKTPNPDPSRCAIYGYGAGADPVVRAGTNGLIYYAGLAFDRALPATPDVPGKSAIFVSRFIDNNNKENGDTFQFLGTRRLQTEAGGAGGDFLDKPWMVVDIPRNNARCTIVTPTDAGSINQSVPAGPVYVAYTLRSTDNDGARYDVFFTMSANCGDSWTTPVRLNDQKDRANQGATMAIDPLTGDVHTAWRSFDLDGDDDALMTVKFDLSDKKLKEPKIARKYLKNKNKKKIDTDKFFKKSGIGPAIQAALLSPLDQGTSDINGLLAFRTNAYPSMAIDATGRLYLVWAERGYAAASPDPVTGDARIVISTSTTGDNWSAPVPIADETVPTPNGAVSARGHQLMPSIAFAGGKLMVVYYDLRETRSKSFNKFIDDVTAFTDPLGSGLRHTLDIRASMATPGAPPAFAPSVRVSDYLEGPLTQGGPNVPLQVNPPNLPMFVRGTAPFIGDYVDVTAAPAMILDATGNWKYNTAAGPTEPIFHATWTDNRDVRVPLEDVNLDGNPWNDYRPPDYAGGFSPLDPTRLVPMCIPGNAGSRNQNIYSARITGGLLVGSPGNTKKLGFKVDENGQPTTELMQRSFVVFAQNTSEVEHIFRLTITSQPPGGRASFTQFDPLVTVIEAVVPRRSTASRTVYVTSTDPHARLNISVAEIVALNGAVVVGGLAGQITLNPDLDNPDLDNPDLDNPDLDNPDINNLEVYNPDLDNPDLDNPDLDNPDLDNPDLDNPDLDNVRVANPDLDNPDLDNPDLDNPDIANPDLDNPDLDNADIENTSLMTDITWSITNNGNTTAAYNVNLFFAQTTFRPEIKTQLILYRTYRTPVVQNCLLKFETRNVLVANVPNPQLVESSTGEVSDPNDPEPSNATIYLAPGESAKITLRVFDPDPPPGTTVVVTNQDGTTAVVPTAFVPNEDVTPVVQQQSVNTEDVEVGLVEPPIVVHFPAPQAVPDGVSTAPHTPVTINVLANDSTAFGSTKVISLHPDGMATHTGGVPGDLTYQPASGFLYTQRGAIDPNTDTLVGRFGAAPNGFGIIGHQANPITGINYGKAGAPNGGAVLTAFDTRPGSSTLHQYLVMPAVTDTVFNIALDTTHHRLYVVHGTNAVTATAALSAVDIEPGSPTFHQVLFTSVIPGNVRGQVVAVNSRTQQVYVSATNANGGVYLFDATQPNPPALKIAGTTNAWGIVINDAANLVFAATTVGGNFALFAIDGATLAMTLVGTGVPMRFGSNEERLVLHEGTGKVFMRLETTVVIIDGQRGSPTRNTVVGTVSGLGRDSAVDIAVDQQLGLVVTVGGFDFRADIIDVASNGLVATIPLLNGPTDVAIDQVNHRAFVSVPLTHVQEINLNPIAPTARVAVFVESGGAIVNPVTNKAYSGFQAITSGIAKVSGAGFDGLIPGVREEGRYVFSARHDATNRYFLLSQGNQSGTGAAPGSMIVVDGATDAVISVVDTLPNPFGIAVNQATGFVYVAALNSPLGAGGIQKFDANNLAAAPVLIGGGATLPAGPGSPGATLSFGRHVAVNPTTGKVYTLQVNGIASTASIVEIDPATDQMIALDGVAAAPLGNTFGRADVIRVSASNHLYVGMFDSATGTTRIVAMDAASNTVIGTWAGGSHSGRHTASYLIENNDTLYVTDFNNDAVTMLDGLNLNTATPVVTALPDGPSATAFNVAANRLYVSSINSKTLTALDGATLALLSSVRLPLVAHFLFVDEVESRLYTSGGDSSDESGIMVVTDVLGQLGTNVSVSGVGAASNGLVQLNADYSVTYTPDPGFMGVDQFSYTITAPSGSATGTVTVNVVPSIPSSVAFGDAYTTAVNTLLTVAAPGPMGNDATGGAATMVVSQTTSDGVLTEQPDGSFTYQPDPGFTGTDTFQYHTVGPLGASNTANVTIAVTAALDLVVTNISDGGAGSLRQAMLTANIEPGSSIRFNIPGAGPHTIQPATALPTINVPVTIDGFTQPGSSPNTAFVGTNAVMKIVVRGPAGGSNGFDLRGGNSTIRGLVINGFSSNNGILLDGGPGAGGNTIEGNFIGTDATGTTAAPNQTGISSQSPNNLIGGTSLASRNLISGNTNQGARALARHTNGIISSIGSGTMFKNNLIGTKANGMTALANGGGGLTMSAPNVVVGGPTVAERNVISGNGNTGISAFANVFHPSGGPPPIVVSAASGLVVQGNFIGTAADGLSSLPNTNGGVSANGAGTMIGGGAGTTPGGACTGACNLITGNIGNAVSLGNSYENNTASPFAGTLYSSAANSIVEGNYIGVNVNGITVATMGNTNVGVSVSAPNVRIGGGTPETRNVISGNGAGTNSGINIGVNTVNGTATMVENGRGALIRGNYIGLNANGTAGAANGTGINVSVPDVVIGGVSAGDRNIISGNVQSGINTFASTFSSTGTAPFTVLAVPSGLVVQGNYIGTSVDGLSAIGNGHNGINAGGANTIIGGGAGTTPGGACTGACNLISGNGGGGVSLHSNHDQASGQLYSSASNSVVEGNYIGVNVTGTAALGNLGQGMNVNAANILIGGGTPATRNVIGGNTTNNASGINVGYSSAGSTLVASGEGAIIRGNYIGLRADGTAPIPNGTGINVSVPNVRIGGTTPSDRNVISGNNQQGVNSFSGVPFGSLSALTHPTGLIVQGNYVGTSPDGLAAMGNGGNGINVSGAKSVIGGTTGVTVGGACTGACNLVSGNGSGISAGFSYNFNGGGEAHGSATGTTIYGNYVGLNVLGTATIPNNGTGIAVSAPSIVVGDATPAGRNLVAGNATQGIGVGTNFTGSNVLVGTGEAAFIRGNWVGFNAAGTAAFPNGHAGIGSGAPNVTIGGPNAADGNVVVAGPSSSAISLYRSTSGAVVMSEGGNSLVQNNFIGTNPAGTARMNTAGSGVSIQTANNQVLNNVIAGNGIIGPPSVFATGISISGSFATGNTARGNFIGTNASGDAGLGNTGSGIYIDGSNNTIGGTNPADRNIVVASLASGINIGTSPSAPGTTSGNVVLGNYIGVLADGVTPMPNNTGVGFFASTGGTVSGNTVGGTTAAHRNIISGNNQSGVSLGGNTTGNTVAGNYIGVAADGTTPAGNTSAGIFVNDSSGNTFSDNLIRFNQVGIALQTPLPPQVPGLRNQLLGNRISSNTNLGIDLGWNGVTANDPGDGDDGANNYQNFPVITDASNTSPTETQVTLDLSSFASGAYTLQFFSSATCDPSGYGQGEQLIATILASAPGFGTFSLPHTPAGHAITATATDSDGNTSEFSACAIVNGTVVTTASDSGAGSLRAAITNANSMPGTQTITFDIPGVLPASPALIAAVSSLPVITQPVIIDATTQPGYDTRPVVELTSQTPLAGRGFDVQANGVTIRGLMITKFNEGISTQMGTTGHLFERNVIGTNRDNLAGLGNFNGINVQAGGTLVQHNVIGGNSNDVQVSKGGFNTVANNIIGVGHDGLTTLPPGNGGIVVFDGASDTAIDGNLIAGKGGWGVDIQNTGAQPGNTRLRNNTIGLNANGAALANAFGGVRNDWGNGTRIGEPGARNIISGNGGPGIWISGNPVNTPLIQNNYIGTDPAGSAERGNATHGITVDGTVAVQIGGASTGEGNVISGNHQHGINVNGAVTAAAVIHGNIIGLNAAGDAMLGNTHSGISASNSALNVGGPSAGMRNVISGNQQGVVFSNSGSTRHSNVSGNYIGTDITGMLARGNSTGVVVGSAPGTVITGNVISGNSIGVTIDNISHPVIGGAYNAKVEGNIIGLNKDKNGAVPNGTGVHLANNDNLIGGDPNFISGNTGIGIRVASAGVRNWITENAIFNNGGLGIDLDNDGVTANDNGDMDGDADDRGNDAQNFPVLSGATSSSGVLTQVNVDISTFKVGTYIVEFFASATCDASGHGEGQRYVGRRSVVQPGGGNVTVNELVPAGEFLTATATDSLGNTSEFGGCVEVDPAIVVSNTNDSGPGSLREAIIDANSTPGQQTISFNIPGVTAATPAVINITSAALPAITDTVLINGIGQSGYDGLPVIEVRGPNTTNGWSGFEVNSVGVSINGLSITRFTYGVAGWQGLTGNVIEMNFIGTNRSYTAGLGNGDGVFWRASSSAISHNVISGNSTGIILNLGGSSNTIEGNKIGLAHDGVTPVPNGGHGVVLYDGASSNTFINNIISANAGWGVDIQHSGALAPVTDTKFYKNIIGLAANGDLIGVGAPRFEGPTSYGPDVDFGPMQRGNWAGGIHVVNGPGTLIGDPQSGFHNTISGNSGPGILMDVVPGGGPVSKIQNNIIGLDPTGAIARGNGAHGIFSLAPNTRIGGTGPFESNVISANIANGVVAAGDGVSQHIVNNLIGTNHDGTTTTGTDGKPLGNGVLTDPAFGCCKAGVYLTSGNNQVVDNVIAGNQIGVRSSAGAPSLPNLIDHNFIGTNAAGVISAANTKGVFLAGDTVGTHVTRNTIKHSHEDGILVAEGSSGARIGGSVAEANLITANNVGIVVGYDATAADIQIAISHNSIHNNALIGIDLGNDGPTANDGPTMEDFDDGPNRLQNYPTITRVTNEGTDTRVEGVIESAANTTFTLHVYSSSTCDPSGFGEAETFRHAHNQGTNSVGQGFFSFVFPGPLPAGQVVTMTATDPAGNTSELSQCAEVPEQFTVAGTAGGQANLNNPPSGTAPVSTVTLGPNQQVTISATGLVDYGSGTADTGPNGLGVPAPGDNLAPGLTSVSLIGRIDGGAWQQIGAGPTLLTAGPAGGVLELALNDSSYDDNQGSWTAYVWKH